jgi:hypothetical protein
MLFGNGPHQAFLNQIVGDRRIAGQCARVAPKPGNLLFEEFTEIAHGAASLKGGTNGANSGQITLTFAGP